MHTKPYLDGRRYTPGFEQSPVLHLCPSIRFYTTCVGCSGISSFMHDAETVQPYERRVLSTEDVLRLLLNGLESEYFKIHSIVSLEKPILVRTDFSWSSLLCG